MNTKREREYTFKEKLYLIYRLFITIAIMAATTGYILFGWWMLYLIMSR